MPTSGWSIGCSPRPTMASTGARHWLDLVRFGETNGYERDSAKPFAWRYRDYVIDAYQPRQALRPVRPRATGRRRDRPGSAESLIATGFYRLGIWDDEPADRLQAAIRYARRHHLDDRSGRAGDDRELARCHDHKVDPIPQRDYYRLLAFFIDVTHSGREEPQESRRPIRDADRGDVRRRSEVGIRRMCCSAAARPGRAGRRARRARGARRRDRVNREGTRQASGAGRLADGSSQSPDGPRAGQSHLAISFRPGDRADPQRLRQAGRAGNPSRAAGLAGCRVGRERMADQADASAHRDVERYRMSSRATQAELAADPANRWFWRFPMRRLAAEEVRDAMLAVSGDLRSQGRRAERLSADPPRGDGRPVGARQRVEDLTPDDAARRSVYVHVKRSLLVPILAVHDAADTDSSCPVRYTTTVPTQALGMLNGAFANEQAVHLADRLRREAPGDLDAQVRRALRLTAARNADQDEVRGDVEFIQTLMGRSQLDEQRGPLPILPDDPQCQCLPSIDTSECETRRMPCLHDPMRTTP